MEDTNADFAAIIGWLHREFQGIDYKYYDQALDYVRYAGIQGLVWGFVLAAVAFGAAFVSYLLYKDLTKIVAEKEQPGDEGDFNIGAMIFLAMVFVVSSIVAGMHLFNVFNWVAITNPEIALAKDVVERVLR